MKQINYFSNVTLILFLAGILLSALSFIFPDVKNLYIGILFIAILYLVLGWYLFRGYFKNSHPLVLFLFGYLYASIFLAATFKFADWPLSETLVCLSLFWAFVLFALIVVLKKKMPAGGFIRFIIEACLMIVLSILLIII